MKKRFQILIVLLACSVCSCYGQMAQMIQTELQQIAELEVYLKAAEKGYQITQQGWATIKDIKNGEFNLHATFFASLKSVNPQVAKVAEVSEIVALETSMVIQFKQLLSKYQSSTLLGPTEQSYLSTVYQCIIKACNDNTAMLQSIITDNALSMDDGERLKRIDMLDTQAKTQYQSVQGIIAQTDMLAVSRNQSSGDIGALQSFYGIN